MEAREKKDYEVERENDMGSACSFAVKLVADLPLGFHNAKYKFSFDTAHIQ